VANWIQSLKEFPPRQKPVRFKINHVMQRLVEA
jgi:hypothetical protein